MNKSKKACSDSLKYPSRFGMAAIRLGFVSPQQLREAMLEQLDINLETRVHRLIGEILHSKGWMTQEQVETTLEHMD